MKKLLIIGAGGHGKVVADAAIEACKWERVCFLDDNESIANIPCEIIGGIEQLSKYINDFEIVVAIGNNKKREQLLRLVKEMGGVLGRVFHPKASISKYAEVDAGVVVFANAVINAYAKVDLGSIINTGAIIEHDCLLYPCVHVSPNATLAGNVEVGQGSWIGMGCSVIERISVGGNAIIGAGSVVINDIGNNVIAVGNPAKVIKENEK